MAPTPVTPDWLPDHQLSVPLTLAYADEQTERLCSLLFEHGLHGMFDMKNVVEGDLCHVTVTAVKPIPPAVPRIAADVLIELRAALEHTVYAEVESMLKRELTSDEQRRVEMPAAVNATEFTKWLNGSKRKGLAPLRDGSALINRIRRLQPYHRKDPDQHPLRLLSTLTNLAKHRTPAVATVRLGRVHTWPLNDPDVLIGSRGAALEVGTVLATGPKFKQVPLDIWPQISIQRPHTGEWAILIKELGALADWVRTVAIPVIITGEAHAESPLPPQIDTTRGWANEREALNSGRPLPADQRHTARLQGQTARNELPGILAMHADYPGPDVIQGWIDGLTDAEIVAELRTFSTDPLITDQAVRIMIRKAQEAARPEQPGLLNE